MDSTQAPEEAAGPDLIRDLARALEHPEPVAFLDAASVIAAFLAEPVGDADRGIDPARAERVVSDFLEAGLRETDAVLRVWAEMLDDEELRRRIAASLAQRDHDLPDWLHRLDEIRPTEALTVGDAPGENETLFIDVSTPAAPLVLAVAVAHSGGPALEDAYLLPCGLGEALRQLDADAAVEGEGEGAPLSGTIRSALALADARARIDQTLGAADRAPAPIETETWPGTRPFLEWMTRLMPEGGAGFDHREWRPDEVEALAREFLASPEAAGLGDDAAPHAERLLGLQADRGSGHPLRWGAGFVERVLCDLYPPRVSADAASMRSMPTALRALIRYANARSDMPEMFTRDALETVDAREAAYLRRVGAE